MAEDTLCDCGEEIIQSGKGRPRLYCDLCLAKRLTKQRRDSTRKRNTLVRTLLEQHRLRELLGES